MPLSATAWWFRLSVAAWAEAPRQLLKLARSLSALSLRLSVTRLPLLLLLLRLCHKNSFIVSHCWMTLLQAAPDVNRASFKINFRLFMKLQNGDGANFTQLIALTKYPTNQLYTKRNSPQFCKIYLFGCLLNVPWEGCHKSYICPLIRLYSWSQEVKEMLSQLGNSLPGSVQRCPWFWILWYGISVFFSWW